MARLALEQALPAAWVDEVFEEHRQRQYPRELMFSAIVELMTLVTLGLRPSLHAAARKMENLPVSLAALYDKVKRTEPAVLRGLVRGSGQRLMPVAAQLDDRASLPGWQLRIVDGNHLPASEKRLQLLRGHRGAALPGHSLVVYDPDLGVVCDVVACEDAHESERVGVQPLVDGAQSGELWIADRHFCTLAITQGFSRAGAGFIVREHARHPRLVRPCASTRATRVWCGTARGSSTSVSTRAGCESAALKSRASTTLQTRPPHWCGAASRSNWTPRPKRATRRFGCGPICRARWMLQRLPRCTANVGE